MIRMVMILIAISLGWYLTPSQVHWPWMWLFAAILILPSVISNVLHMRVAAQIDHWAAAQGLKLRGYELALFKKGPFTWTTSDCQRVLRITVLEGKQLKKGWLVVGDWNLGLIWPKIRIRWD